MVEEEVDERAEDRHCQKEKEDGPGVTALGSDGGVADGTSHAGGVSIAQFAWCGIAGDGSAAWERAGGQEIPSQAQAQGARASLDGKGFSIHKNLDVAVDALTFKRLLKFGRKLFRQANDLLREVTFDLFLRALHRLGTGVGGMEGEAASGLALDMKAEFAFLALQRQLQGGKTLRQASHDGCLNLLLQFFTRGRFQRRQVGIAGMSDETAFGLGRDGISKLRDKALDFHVARL